MNEPTPPCSASCPADGACHAPITLREARERFAREAVRGDCDTGRYRCRYYAWGEGPTLLVVPGLAEGAESFILLCARLASRFRCVAYDLPGAADDGSRLGGYTHADLTADVFALLDRLDVRQSYVFGSSFGSTIALAAMHARPERLPRCVLVGGFARRPLAPAERCLVSLARFLPGRMGNIPLRDALLRRAHGAAFVGREEEVWNYFLQRSALPAIAAVAHRARLMHDVDLRPLLRQIRQPILMVSGDCDPLVGKDRQGDLLRGLPNVVRVELEQCGHFPQYTHPELLAELVRSFLTADQNTCGGSTPAATGPACGRSPRS